MYIVLDVINYINCKDRVTLSLSGRKTHLDRYRFTRKEPLRGRGYWKFNTRYLQDKQYIDEINALLERKLIESGDMDDTSKWFFLKTAIIRASKEYAKNNVKEQTLIISQLSEKINEMQYQVAKEQMNDAQKIKILESSVAELDALLQENAKETIFRTKSNWYELGEKSNKFFLNMEKRRYNARLCSQIITEDGEITDAKEVQKAQFLLYKQLYKSDTSVNFSLCNDTDIKVTEMTQERDQQPFSFEEMRTALMQLKSGKTPGEDGIPPELIKMFFKYLGMPLYNMIIKSFEEKKLPSSITTGIINLIPKANKDSRKLQNLRPITLLCTSYKVVEKMIANRLEKSLERIISKAQTGFMKQRRIAVNIRRIFELMTFTQNHNIDAMILSLDFMKCFDKIEKKKQLY